MADYWIKLYLEILDDSKMAVLPDRLWRRVIELFLMAGRFHQEGNLPDTRQLAWILRMPSDDLEMDMQQIAGTGIIQKIVNGWYIPKFAKRQAASTSTERVHQFRKKEQRNQYADETNLKRNVTQINRLTDTDTDTESETEQKQNAPPPAEKRPELFDVYEHNIGSLNAIIADTLIDAEKEYTGEWCIAAIAEAVKSNAPNWRYCEAILKRWKKDGRYSQRKNSSKKGEVAEAEVIQTNLKAQMAAHPDWYANNEEE